MTTTSNSQPVGLLVKFTAQPGKGAEMAAVLSGVASQVAAEPGTLLWQVDVQANNPDVVFLHERYESADAMDAHNSTELNAKTENKLVPSWGPPKVFPLLRAGGIK
jgi:quinol monooxygenase YgiN